MTLIFNAIDLKLSSNATGTIRFVSDIAKITTAPKRASNYDCLHKINLRFPTKMYLEIGLASGVVIFERWQAVRLVFFLIFHIR